MKAKKRTIVYYVMGENKVKYLSFSNIDEIIAHLKFENLHVVAIDNKSDDGCFLEVERVKK